MYTFYFYFRGKGPKKSGRKKVAEAGGQEGLGPCTSGFPWLEKGYDPFLAFGGKWVSKVGVGAGEMAEQFRALTALTEDLSIVHSPDGRRQHYL